MRFQALMTLICSLLGLALTLPALGQEEESLKDLEKLLQTRISTAAKYEQIARDVPASVTVVSREEIERFSYRTLDEVLRAVPGFYTSYDRNYAYLGTRGFSRPTDYNTRILLLINGFALNDGMYQQAPIGTDLGLDLSLVDRIEIVRGPSSAVYGTGAMFAVINIITRTGKDIDGVRLAVEAGSFRSFRGAVLAGKAFRNGADLTVGGQWSDARGQDLFFPEYDSPATNRGWAIGLDWDRSVGVHSRLAWRDWTLQGLATVREKGIPTGAWGVLFNDPRAKTSDARSFLDLSWNGGWGPGTRFSFRGYAGRYDYRGWYPYPDSLSRDSTVSEWIGGEARFRWDPFPNTRLSAGFEGVDYRRADYRIWDETGDQFNGDFPYRVFSLFAQEEIQVSKGFELTFGFRYDKRSEIGEALSPRAAVIYHPNPATTLKVLYGGAFRSPNPYELHYEDLDVGFGANPALRPEFIRTLEILWERAIGGTFFGSIGAYHYEMKDLIEQAPGSDSIIRFRNVGRVTAEGIELGLVGRWGSGRWLQASYALEQAHNAETWDLLTNSPAQIVKLGLSIPVGDLGAVSGRVLFESGRKTVYGGWTRPYGVADLTAATGKRFEPFRVSVCLRNLTDTRYALPGGYELTQAAIVQDPRTFSIRLEYHF
jgi:outer membrane receptor for ferrienterochelin and colicins